MRMVAAPRPVELLGGEEVHDAVVVAGVVGKQHAEPVADGDAGGDDEEAGR